MGMIIAGPAATEAIDTSGEILDVKGADISCMQDNTGVANWEHRGPESEAASALDIVGSIRSAVKIFSKKDCTTEDQHYHWDRLELPFIYITVELFDDENHAAALALAAMIRYYHRRHLPIVARFSIEGSTLRRVDNILKETIGRAVAITMRPANRSCDTTVLHDPLGDENLKTREDFIREPDQERLASHEFEWLPQIHEAATPFEILQDSLEHLREISALTKALSAGGYNSAPGTLTGGSALQVEDFAGTRDVLRPQVLAAYRDWPRSQTFKKFLKHRLPDVSDSYLDHYANIIDDFHVKKAEELETNLFKAMEPETPAPEPTTPGPKIKIADEQLTVGGKKLRPIPSLGRASKFDERQGILYTPRGSFKMYIPSRDPNPGARESFHNILNSDKVNAFHNYAMDNWAKLHTLLKAGQLPPEVVQHATLFSNLSPNCLDAETEALTQRGWVRGFDLTMDDVILTKNPDTGILEWQKPQDLKFFPDYEGPLVELTSRSFSAITTPDHRWLVTTQRGHIGEKTSTNIKFGDKIHRTGTYVYSGVSGLTPDEAELLGWFVTDEHYSVSKACSGKNKNSKYEIAGKYALLNQSAVGNPEKCRHIESLLERLDVKKEVTSAVGRDGKKVWRLGPALTKLMISRAPDRHLTVSSLLDLDVPALQSLQKAMILGDGSKWFGKAKWKSKEILTTGRSEQVDAYQCLLVLLGDSSVVKWRDMSMYTPQSEKMSNIPKMTGIFNVTKLNRKFVSGSGLVRREFVAKMPVWCPMVANTFFVARRHGKVWITGNTPVSMQELMYGHLVDAMKETGVDARHPDFGTVLKQNWMARDNPHDFPQHSRGHFERFADQLRLKGDSAKTTKNPRKVGEIGGFMLPEHKFKLMSQYKNTHDQLMDVVNRHGIDMRGAASDLMHQKHKGQGLPGLAPKTTRYMLGMLGGGNSMVPDTHFVRYLFGLDKGKDAGSIGYLKNLLWDEKNTPLLDAADRYYGKHHDAVHHMLEHPRFKHIFADNPEQAIFPAFWKNWVSIVPHEESRGMTTGGHNESTDHRPFWEAVDQYLPATVKAEQEVPLPLRTARQHAQWAHKYGHPAAMMLFYAHIVPQLIAESHRNKIIKMEILTDKLRKAAGAEPLPSTEPSQEWRGQHIHPGEIEVTGGLHKGSKFKLLGADKDHFHVQDDKGNTSRLKRADERKSFRVNQWHRPAGIPVKDEVIDPEQHGIPWLNDRPEHHDLIRGLKLHQGDDWTGQGITQSYARGRNLPIGWRTNANQEQVFVKPDLGFQAGECVKCDMGYQRLARDFFGLGDLIPTHSSFVDPVSSHHYIASKGVQGAVDGLHPDAYETLQHHLDNGNLDKAAFMDFLLNNRDRHAGNYLITPQDHGLHLIDHAYSMNHNSGLQPEVGRIGLSMSPQWYETLGFVNDSGDLKAPTPMQETFHPGATQWAENLDPYAFAHHLQAAGLDEDQVHNAVTRLTDLQKWIYNNPNAQRTKFWRGK